MLHHFSSFVCGSGSGNANSAPAGRFFIIEIVINVEWKNNKIFELVIFFKNHSMLFVAGAASRYRYGLKQNDKVLAQLFFFKKHYTDCGSNSFFFGQFNFINTSTGIFPPFISSSPAHVSPAVISHDRSRK
jgi:hypothetical protein